MGLDVSPAFSFPAPQAAAVDPYLLALRIALRATFVAHPVIAATDGDSLAKNAQIMPMYTNVQVAFQAHIRKDVIRAMISSVDVSDDSQLSDLQTQLLALPEWTTDTSDVA